MWTSVNFSLFLCYLIQKVKKKRIFTGNKQTNNYFGSTRNLQQPWSIQITKCKYFFPVVASSSANIYIFRVGCLIQAVLASFTCLSFNLLESNSSFPHLHLSFLQKSKEVNESFIRDKKLYPWSSLFCSPYNIHSCRQNVCLPFCAKEVRWDDLHSGLAVGTILYATTTIWHNSTVQ